MIAVLPFAERGGAAGEGYFADGVTEDVIGALGRFSGLVVLSWSAVAPYRGQTQTLAELGAKLGAGFVVGGSIQRAGGRIRVNVQLSAAADGALIWSNRYDEDLADIFAVQDRITQQVVSALTVRVTQVEQARVMAAPTASLGAYDSVLRGREAFRSVERSRNIEARALFERALELDPRYADAHVELGWTHLSDLKSGWTQWPQRALDAARAVAERAIALDPQNASGHALLADALKFLGDMAGAERAIDKALELNSNSALAHASRASVMLFTARSAEALAAMQTALRLDPYPRAEWLMSLLAGQFLQGRYADVLETYRRYPREIGGVPTRLTVVAAAHARLGDTAAAREIAAQVRRAAPFLDSAGLVRLLGTPAEQAVFAEGLRGAGLLD
ncbi:MAG: tetratricopeptide repeat protein [Alphaproteobacteria bacterium]|nr:tetratricopeptide repeat protein [Alphaproteobacteria bacterium]